MTRRVSRSVTLAWLPTLVLAVGSFVSSASSARAATIFSQTPVVTGTGASDLNFDANGNQMADDFTLAAPATVRSVVWRGVFVDDTDVTYPFTFDLVLYGSTAGNLPNTANVLSATTVTITSAGDYTDTGIDTQGFPRNVYEFRANMTPTALAAATTYWFSPLGDSAGVFYWGTAFANDAAASRTDVAGNGACTGEIPPAADYTDAPTCGDVYVSGTYSLPLTIAVVMM